MHDPEILPPATTVTVPIRALPPSQVWLAEEHSHICNGAAPKPGSYRLPIGGPTPPTDAEIDAVITQQPMRFHLGISQSGERLLLFREGYLPQEMLIADLVSAWLIATGSPPVGSEEGEATPWPT